jgi:hypothetical protein
MPVYSDLLASDAGLAALACSVETTMGCIHVRSHLHTLTNRPTGGGDDTYRQEGSDALSALPTRLEAAEIASAIGVTDAGKIRQLQRDLDRIAEFGRRRGRMTRRPRRAARAGPPKRSGDMSCRS